MNGKFLCAIACVCTYFNFTMAQTNTFPATGSAGVGTLSPATTLQVIGKSRFGAANNYAQFDETGNLKFNGSAYYKLLDDQYAFRYVNNLNYGLFFNSTDKFWEFKDSTATAIFKIDIDKGNAMFKGGLSVGKIITPPANGLYVSGNVGIGTGTPDAKLQITGGDNTTLTSGGTIVVGPVGQHNLAIDNDEIQARNNGTADKLLLNKNGGNVGIGTASPIVPLHVDGGFALSLKGGGDIVAGSFQNFNLAISDNAIQARNNAKASQLFLNKDGGDAMFGGALGINGSTLASSAKLQVVLATDATLTDGGYIEAGPTSLKNIVMDASQIQARNNGSTAELFLNRNGGTVITGDDLHVDGSTIEINGNGFGGFQVINDFVTSSIGDFVAGSDNSDKLGNSSHRWLEVWSVDGSVNTSDARDKTNIRTLNYGLKEIMQLKPVRFNWKNKIENGDKLGLIAQDLQKVLPEVVKDYEYKKDLSGKAEKISATRLGVMYADIIPVLIKGMQQQQQMIEEQQQLIKEQDKKIETLTQLVNQLINKNSVQTNESRINNNEIVSSALLEQNAPNPFNSNTIIRYTIPSTAKQSALVITNTNGQTIKTFSINKKGAGQITIYANELISGNYFYSLIIDGKKMSTLKMVLTK